MWHGSYGLKPVVCLAWDGLGASWRCSAVIAMRRRKAWLPASFCLDGLCRKSRIGDHSKERSGSLGLGSFDSQVSKIYPRLSNWVFPC